MGGMVTYSNESKEKHLGIPMDDIRKYGAVSSRVARKMAQGVQKTFNTTFGLSTTGVAGQPVEPRDPDWARFRRLANRKRAWAIKLNLEGVAGRLRGRRPRRGFSFSMKKWLTASYESFALEILFFCLIIDKTPSPHLLLRGGE